jgi:hypothetical protein
MIGSGEPICPDCGGDLKYYDKVQRILRTKGRASKHVIVRRLRCAKCGRVHRELPDYILPYKQYEAGIIKGVLDGRITSDTIGFEDHPCEMTMVRWRLQKLRIMEAMNTLKGA